jgi:hypothetical protein
MTDSRSRAHDSARFSAKKRETLGVFVKQRSKAVWYEGAATSRCVTQITVSAPSGYQWVHFLSAAP